MLRALVARSLRADTPLASVELEAPAVRPGEVGVEVRAIGVNPVDWKMRQLSPLRLAQAFLGPRGPLVVGIDFAGVVSEVGDAVARFALGASVVGGIDFSRKQRGSDATRVVGREEQIGGLPNGIDFETAAALPVAGVTAFMSIVEVGGLLRVEAAHRRVLVLGASGGVGQIAVQLARASGAFVVGVCSGRNVDRVRKLGCDVVLDYTASDPLEEARRLAPFQVVVDCVGTFSGRKSRALLAPRGRHVRVAGESLRVVVDSLLHPTRSKLILGRVTAARLSPVVEAVAKGELVIDLAHKLPLEEADEAHRTSRTGRTTGKIVLLP